MMISGKRSALSVATENAADKVVDFRYDTAHAKLRAFMKVIFEKSSTINIAMLIVSTPD